MKKYFKNIIVLAILSIIVSQTFAQEKSQRKINQLFYDGQFAVVKKALNMDENQAKKFDLVYRKYIQEIDNERQLPQHYKVLTDTITDAKAEQLILGQISEGRKFLEIRERYYYEFKKILSSKDIYKLFRIEQEIHRKIIQEYKKRK